jgi:hypothetical protein
MLSILYPTNTKAVVSRTRFDERIKRCVRQWHTFFFPTGTVLPFFTVKPDYRPCRNMSDAPTNENSKRWARVQQFLKDGFNDDSDVLLPQYQLSLLNVGLEDGANAGKGASKSEEEVVLTVKLGLSISTRTQDMAPSGTHTVHLRLLQDEDATAVLCVRPWSTYSRSH